jgi:hypothetical protein
LFSAAFPALAQDKTAEREFPFLPAQSVYVIAVKSRAPRDRSVWENLNRNLPQVKIAGGAGTASDKRATLDREVADRPTLERSTPVRRVLPPSEPKLKKQIEDEFLKQKTFKLADSPETADFIFFASGDYFHYEAMQHGNGASTVIGMIGPGDDNLELNALAKLSVGVIMASDYRQWQSDLSDLLKVAKWRTEAWGEFQRKREMRYEEPSLKKLIQEFHKQALKK